MSATVTQARAAGTQLARVEVHSRTALRHWLESHASESRPIWLVTYKKSARPDFYVPYSDIVEEALCFGWIDSLPRSLDDERSMRLLSPRKRGSSWSRRNQQLAEKLIASKQMTPAGQAVIDQARKDGSWSRLDDVEQSTVPPDLQAELHRVAHADDNFSAFPRSTKRAILEWILNAKTPETRLRRIHETATLAGKNIRANQYRQPKSASRHREAKA